MACLRFVCNVELGDRHRAFIINEGTVSTSWIFHYVPKQDYGLKLAIPVPHPFTDFENHYLLYILETKSSLISLTHVALKHVRQLRTRRACLGTERVYNATLLIEITNY